MKITLTEFKLLRDYLEERSGICLNEDKAYLLENRLASVIESYKCKDFSEFYYILKGAKHEDLDNKLIDIMTTNETLWFRDAHPYAILKEKILPSFVQAVKDGKKDKIKIWSAASSTGQEPYSIAIAVRDFCMGQNIIKKEMVHILATDISDSCIEKAKTGIYDSIAMSRGITQEQLNRYFMKETANSYSINHEIKSMVKFQKFNLQDNPIILEPHFDLVFMRYVAIYFSDEFKKGLYNRLARILSPNGFLIIGAVETLRGLSESFDMMTHAGGMYYQCKR
ncbi:MAG: protein-glutamate O-methyltransferase CheR [Fibromonadaceae bacterium]|jgi:chemotaxis protein methyltransferase CheR|nr:protein-glutamate O-methyltransferase CheR [Fibromonadaceae bacterium]